MQDLCHATRNIRMSSNPTESFLKKFFSAFTFWGCIFSCAFYYFLRIVFCVVVCFDFCVFLLYCILLYFF